MNTFLGGALCFHRVVWECKTVFEKRRWGGKGQQAGSHAILPAAANTGTCLSVDAQLMLCSVEHGVWE